MAKFAAEEASLAINYKMLTLDLLPYQSRKLVESRAENLSSSHFPKIR